MVFVADTLCARIEGVGLLLAFSRAITLSDCWQPLKSGTGGVAAMIQIADVL